MITTRAGCAMRALPKMRRKLLDSDGRFLRREIHASAVELQQQMSRLGEDWTIYRCLRFKWHEARGRREQARFALLEAAARAALSG